LPVAWSCPSALVLEHVVGHLSRVKESRERRKAGEGEDAGKNK
jgi:hypothetical protein